MTPSTPTTLALLVASCAGVALTQPRLANMVHEVKNQEDIYVLPPPAELHLATLGWDSAVADLLWAKLLVAHGTHWSEHVDFKDVPRYVDSILELEPGYRPVFSIVDTLLMYRPLRGTADDVRLARRYLEEGTRDYPDDARLWRQYGQFLAFSAPSFLQDPKEISEWRAAGARAIDHAIELGADADDAMAADQFLTGAGATQEAIRYLEHAYVFTEHPAMTEVHETIGRRLAALHATAVLGKADAAARIFEARWKSDLPSMPMGMYRLLGPVVDPWRCAGPGLAAAVVARCERDWVDLPDETMP